MPMNGLPRPIEMLRPGVVAFGPGTAASVGTGAETQGYQRALVVSDAFNAGRIGLLPASPGGLVVVGTSSRRLQASVDVQGTAVRPEVAVMLRPCPAGVHRQPLPRPRA